MEAGIQFENELIAIIKKSHKVHQVSYNGRIDCRSVSKFEETKDLIFWENYHIKNAERDVYRALNAHNITIQNRIKDEL